MKPFTFYRIIILLFIFGTANLYATKPATTNQSSIEKVANISSKKVVTEQPKKSKRKSRLVEKFKKKFAYLFTKDDVSQNENLETRPLGSATAALILGIIGLITSFTGFGLVLSLLALIFGAVSRKKIKNSGGFYTGKSMATAGFILGLIPMAAFVLLLIIVIIAGGF